MLRTGEKIKFYNKDAVVLIWQESEVLLFIDEGYVKWVDKTVLESVQFA